MAIAKNFLKFPQAMAMQWPLPLGKARAWETPRPKKYQGYGFRTLLSRAAKIASRRAKKALEALPFAEKLERAGAVKKPAPQWWKDAKRRAQELAKKIKDSCMNLEFYQVKELDQEEKTIHLPGIINFPCGAWVYMNKAEQKFSFCLMATRQGITSCERR